MDFTINININSEIALHRQVYIELKQAILTGRLKPAEKIPSTRALADILGLSRTTVTQSYEELISEGYLETIKGSGTFISEHLPEKLLQTKSTTTLKREIISTNITVKLSKYGQKLTRIPLIPKSENIKISFDAWSPDLKYFPLKEWGKLLSRFCRSEENELLGYDTDPLGYWPLREAIAKYLNRARAVNCNGSQVIIVNGSQQGLDFVARAFIDAGDIVAIEDPGYLGAKQSFTAYGAKLQPIKVDNNGFMVDQLKAKSKKPVKLVYLTPSHQFPTGVVLSLPRRLELLAWATEKNLLIIEDDYNSEYRYSGRPIPALQGLNHNNNVIYIGTFSKVLFPALRVGYLVVPPALVKIFSQIKYLADRLTPMMEQSVLTEFINNGSLERHIRKMRTIYHVRRKVMVTALTEHFGHNIEIVSENAGMHLMVRLKSKLVEQEIIERAANKGIEIISAQNYYLKPNRKNEFIFGYATLTEKTINDGIAKLARSLR